MSTSGETSARVDDSILSKRFLPEPWGRGSLAPDSAPRAAFRPALAGRALGLASATTPPAAWLGPLLAVSPKAEQLEARWASAPAMSAAEPDSGARERAWAFRRFSLPAALLPAAERSETRWSILLRRWDACPAPQRLRATHRKHRATLASRRRMASSRRSSLAPPSTPAGAALALPSDIPLTRLLARQSIHFASPWRNPFHRLRKCGHPS